MEEKPYDLKLIKTEANSDVLTFLRTEKKKEFTVKAKLSRIAQCGFEYHGLLFSAYQQGVATKKERGIV